MQVKSGVGVREEDRLPRHGVSERSLRIGAETYLEEKTASCGSSRQGDPKEGFGGLGGVLV